MPRLALSIPIGLLTVLAASWVHAASIRFEEFGPFSMRSTAEGQLSSDVKELRTRTTSELQVKYVAPAGHCSTVRMHFLLDGEERGVSDPVAPGKSSGYFDFGMVSAGEHVVGLRAEGIRGGCDGGKLTSWGGFAILRSSLESDAGLDPNAASFGAVVFYAMTVNYAWGYRRQGIYVTAAGDAYAFQYDRTERNWTPAPDSRGRIALFDLQERFSHHTQWLAKLDDQKLQTCESALAALRVTATFRGAYRLDTESGKYVEVPCAHEPN